MFGLLILFLRNAIGQDAARRQRIPSAEADPCLQMNGTLRMGHDGVGMMGWFGRVG